MPFVSSIKLVLSDIVVRTVVGDQSTGVVGLYTGMKGETAFAGNLCGMLS